MAAQGIGSSRHLFPKGKEAEKLDWRMGCETAGGMEIGGWECTRGPSPLVRDGLVLFGPSTCTISLCEPPVE